MNNRRGEGRISLDWRKRTGGRKSLYSRVEAMQLQPEREYLGKRHSTKTQKDTLFRHYSVVSNYIFKKPLTGSSPVL